MNKERLNKFLARCGVASRRKADVLIAEGRVKINSLTVSDPVAFVDSDQDRVMLDGVEITPCQKFTYYALYKPRGYVSTVDDPFAKKKVIELVPDSPRVFPVGRLDKESEGLMLLTDDGEIALKLTHPRYEHEKEYLVTVKKVSGISGPMSHSFLEKSLKRMYKENENPPAGVNIESTNKEEALLRFILKEGKKRQIRKICKSMGLNVVKLIRIRISKLLLGSLCPGQYRKIERDEII
jgi:23S rRNA pseudouridine2605 synthase